MTDDRGLLAGDWDVTTSGHPRMYRRMHWTDPCAVSLRVALQVQRDIDAERVEGGAAVMANLEVAQAALIAEARAEGMDAGREDGAREEREAILAILWDRSEREEYGHAKAAVMLDIAAIRARGEEPKA